MTECGKAFTKLCTKTGIIRYKIVHRIPQQVGLAGRIMKTLLKRVKCTFYSANLLLRFWDETIFITEDLINR